MIGVPHAALLFEFPELPSRPLHLTCGGLETRRSARLRLGRWQVSAQPLGALPRNPRT